MTRKVFIENITKIVDDNLGNPNLKGTYIAEKMGTNRMFIHRRLKLYLQQNTRDFIRTRRMEKAQRLLLNSDLSISEISKALGFKDLPYFSRMFKQHVGIPPSQYRKNKH